MNAQIKIISFDQAKEYCVSWGVEEYQLVDVRQPEEYEEGHFPGAILLPLENLLDGKGDLNPLLPTIVYCHSGFRSAAAAMWMLQNDFKDIYNIQEGFASWSGLQAAGPTTAALQLLPLEGDFDSALAMALTLEEETQALYRQLALKTTNPQTKTLLRRIITLEERHTSKIYRRGGKALAQTSLHQNHLEFIAGGNFFSQTVEQLLQQIEDPIALLSLAMSMEAQAFDFYIRLRALTEDDEKKDFFTEMANEERGHLSMLTQLLDALLIQMRIKG